MAEQAYVPRLKAEYQSRIRAALKAGEGYALNEAREQKMFELVYPDDRVLHSRTRRLRRCNGWSSNRDCKCHTKNQPSHRRFYRRGSDFTKATISSSSRGTTGSEGSE